MGKKCEGEVIWGRSGGDIHTTAGVCVNRASLSSCQRRDSKGSKITGANFRYRSCPPASVGKGRWGWGGENLSL